MSRISLPAVLLFLAAALPVFAGDEVIDVIYIGNSGITYQQMHRTAEEISSRPGFAGPRLAAHPLCRGGSDFAYHLGNIESILRLAEREGCSIAVITGTMTFDADDYRALVLALQKAGLEVVHFQQAESRSRSRAAQLRSDEAYAAVSEELGVRTVPLGIAVWNILTDDDPDYDFFAFDGSHASKKSAYLGACMIVNMLTGLPAAPPPADYDFTYKGMTASDELFLRTTAAEYILTAD